MLVLKKKFPVVPKFVKTVCPKCDRGFLVQDTSLALTVYKGFVYKCDNCNTQYKSSKVLSNMIYDEPDNEEEYLEEDIDLVEIENK